MDIVVAVAVGVAVVDAVAVVVAGCHCRAVVVIVAVVVVVAVVALVAVTLIVAMTVVLVVVGVMVAVVVHGGFGCMISSVPLRWLAIGFCAYGEIFYKRNTWYNILPQSHGNSGDVRSRVRLVVFHQHKAKLEPFRMRFACFLRSISRIQYKKS